MGSISLNTAKHESYIQIWRERVMACRSSGKTIVDWCEENGINLKTYYYWQKRVWDKEIMDLSPETKTKLLEARSVQFAQVKTPLRSAVLGITMHFSMLRSKSRIFPRMNGSKSGTN